jgi:branched-chain amino acid transport system ATP-binding protein
MILSLERLDVFRGPAQILFDVSLQVGEGEAVVLAGRNGAGKSTTLKTSMGLLRARSGTVSFRGRRIERLDPWDIARAGLGYVPEDRRIFGELSVRENLEVGQLPCEGGRTPWTPRRLYELFPALEELGSRRALHLSGGEQQMLTIARTLMGNPRCVLLDEPSEGLAPRVVDDLARALNRLKSEGVALLLSEQNLRFAARVADRAYIIEKGSIRREGALDGLSEAAGALMF